MTSASEAYIRPASLAAAVGVLARGARTIIAGGTDLYPAAVTRPLSGLFLDVSQVSEMRQIAEQRDIIRIGGAVTWSEIVAAPLPPAFDALKAAARDVGSIQIQNRGTIAGNLCNASPAADGVPALLILDAEIELSAARGMRRLPLRDFITGYRQTARASDEILSAIVIPRPNGQSAFHKLGSRRYLVISIVMAAALVEKAADGSIFRAAIAMGAASPVAVRLPELERDLAGLPSGIRPSSRVQREHLDALSPIGDVRAAAWYRSEAAAEVIGRALDRAVGIETP